MKDVVESRVDGTRSRCRSYTLSIYHAIEVYMMSNTTEMMTMKDMQVMAQGAKAFYWLPGYQQEKMLDNRAKAAADRAVWKASIGIK